MRDGSLTMGAGLEVVSPILRDNNEDIEDIYMVCNMLQEAEQEIGSCCGGHVHIGSDYLTSKESYANLFEIWGNTERIMYIISNEKGKIPRQKAGISAAPISKKVREAIEKGTINLDNEEDLNDFIKVLQNVQENELGRADSLNLLNINNGKNTIEFRVANGTINPDTWIENARLFGRIVQISEKLAQIEKKNQSELAEEDKKLVNLMQCLKEEKPEREKMEVLLEMLFTEEERIVYRERYDENSKLLEEASKRRNNPLETLEIAEKVEFRRHSIDEFSEVSRQNCGGYIDTTRETREAVEEQREGNLEQIKNSEKGEKDD